MFIASLVESLISSAGKNIGQKAARPVERMLYSSLLTEEEQEILMDLNRQVNGNK